MVPAWAEIGDGEASLARKYGLNVDAISRELPVGWHYGAWIENSLNAAGRVLDVAGGAGAVAESLTGAEVVVTDIDARRVGHCVERLGGRVYGVACDAEHLSFESQAFDAVLLVRLLHVVPSPRAVLMEAHRVLRVAGRVWVGFTVKARADALDLALAPLRPDAKPPVPVAAYSQRVESLVADCGFGEARVEVIGQAERSESRSGLLKALVERAARTVDAGAVSAFRRAISNVEHMDQTDFTRLSPFALCLLSGQRVEIAREEGRGAVI